jgi:hypothetical protein
MLLLSYGILVLLLLILCFTCDSKMSNLHVFVTRIILLLLAVLQYFVMFYKKSSYCGNVCFNIILKLKLFFGVRNALVLCIIVELHFFNATSFPRYCW